MLAALIVHPSLQRTNRPRLLVVALTPHPDAGSEPGQGYAWARALSEFFEIHLICEGAAIAKCQSAAASRDWVYHAVDVPQPMGAGLTAYRHYYHWTAAVLRRCGELIRQLKPVGVHHATLGAFRILPRYDELGVPYTLGPIGGGEAAPWRLLRGARLPPGQLALEMCRPAINRACVHRPAIAKVLKSARAVLATTHESARLLRAAGARDVTPVFPHALELAIVPGEIHRWRESQAPDLKRALRCIWSGRMVWWKCPQLAILLVARLKAAGVNATLQVFTTDSGRPVLARLAQKMAVADAVRLDGFVPRPQLLGAYRDAHLFINPTLHDSSGSAIPEAYATGLPSLTLGLGGTGVSTAPEAGLNAIPNSIPEWIESAISMARRWQAEPDTWLCASAAALSKAGEFDHATLVRHCEQHLVPRYSSV
jgi:hypothetical protein